MSDKATGSLFKYHLLAAFAITVWGSTFVLSKILIQGGFSPSSLFIYRFAISYVVIIFFAPRRLLADNWRDELTFFVMGITGGSFYFIAENSALGITQASNVSIILAATPLITIILSRMSRKIEHFGKNLLIGGIIAFVGVVLAVLNGSVILKFNPLGDILTLLAALSWAIYCILANLTSGRYSSVFITRKVFFYGLLTSVFFIPFVDFNLTLEPFHDPLNVSVLLFLSLVGSLLCFYIWTIVLNRIGVAAASAYIYFLPVVSLIVAFLVLSEVVTLMALAGVALIMTGVYIAERKGKSDKADK